MRPLPVSHSSLDKFNTCPKQFFEIKVAKNFKDSKGEAAIWGDYVHKEFEVYLRAKGAHELPENLTAYKEYLDAILAQEGVLHVEHAMAVDAKLQPCTFFAADVFLRGYADVLRIKGERAYILDHKTGKRKRNSKQMKMMALLCFLLFPAVMRIRVGFAWLQEKATDAEEFTRSDISALWQEFLPDIKQFRDAFWTDTWQPRQSGLCHGWCAVKTCEFWKPKRLTK